MVSIISNRSSNSSALKSSTPKFELNIHQTFIPFFGSRQTYPHSGPVKPVMQYESNHANVKRQGTVSSTISARKLKMESPLRDQYHILEHHWPRNSGNGFHMGLRSSIKKPKYIHSVARRSFPVDYSNVTSSPFRRFPGGLHTLEAAATCAQSPCLLERVKHLLNQQKIRDARKALELGSIKFPENREIANLLCVVSPGRVVEIDRVSIGRHREISWIKQHGHKYRGKWIALDGDVLVAFAENLRELDGKIVILHQKEQPVFVHYLSNG